jgi:hypothetical protein
VILVIGLASAALLAFRLKRVQRLVVLSVGLAALMIAPATWAAETLGHATSATFPAGGPASADLGGGPGGFGGRGGRAGAFGPPGTASSGAGAVGQLFGGGGPSAGGSGTGGPGPGAGGSGPGAGGFGGGAGGGGMFGGDSASLRAAIRYAEAHGGGTIGVASQSTAAAAILDDHANVAGLGGFSGRESSVSVSWLASEVRSGHLRWVIVDQQTGGLPGDNRAGSRVAMDAVAKACRAIKLSGTSTGSGSTSTTQTIYDCAGRAAAILRAA